MWNREVLKIFVLRWNMGDIPTSSINVTLRVMGGSTTSPGITIGRRGVEGARTSGLCDYEWRVLPIGQIMLDLPVKSYRMAD